MKFLTYQKKDLKINDHRPRNVSYIQAHFQKNEAELLEINSHFY